MDNLFTLPLQRMRPKRYRPGGLGTWSGHLPFANDLIAALRPTLLVELGTHFGESYFGFCQAVQQNNVACRCFAVDTWRGDEHAGFYGESVFGEVRAYNEAEYGTFSTLLRTTFDAAAEQFEPDSIDLLHIDGLHTYNAVKHDFETWFPKVKPGGIVLFHDVRVRHGDFEVWRLWEELAREYAHFEFHHWWGLGLVRKPADARATNALIDLLVNADGDAARQIRERYEDAAELLELRERSPEQRQSAADADRPYLQIFPGDLKAGFLERESTVSNIEPGVWQTHVADFPKGASNGLIRVDPVNRPASIEIRRLTVRGLQGEEILDLRQDRLAELPFGDGLVAIGSAEAARHFSWGNDPRFMVQLPAGTDLTAALRVEIEIRVEFTLELVRDALEQPAVAFASTERSVEQLKAGLEAACKETAGLHLALAREQNRRTRLEWDYSFAQTQREHLENALQQSRAKWEALQNESDAKDTVIRHMKVQIADQSVRLSDIASSLSWKATAPLRALAGPFRSSAQTHLADPNADRISAIETNIERAVGAGKMAGAVLLISRQGKLVSHRSFGFQDREAKIPMSTNSIFRVLSLTKSVTCAALLTLVDDGKVSVEDPVELYLPEFAAVCFEEGRKPKQMPTIRQLMSHTAGMSDAIPEGIFQTDFTLPDFVGLSARNPLAYEPGEGWAYSNGGIASVGRIVEKLSGLGYAEYVRTRIFEPLHMTSSSFRCSEQERKRLVAIYELAGDKLIRETRDQINGWAHYTSPDNGLHTTAHDLWRFFEMIRGGGFANGRRVLSEAAARAMVTVQTLECNAGYLPGMGYGFGLSLVTKPNGLFRNHSPGTFGHGAYYQTHAWTDPLKGITGILFCQNLSKTMVVTEESARFISALGGLE